MGGRFLSGLFAGSGRQKSQPASTLRVSTALQGVPISILLGGQIRMAGNLIDWLNLTSTTSSSSNSSGGGGGKGGSSGSSSSSAGSSSGTVNYAVSFVIALCEGPIDGFTNAWVNGSPGYPSNYEYEGFSGNYTQGPWSYLTAVDPDHALNYRGVAYNALDNMSIGSSPTLPQVTVEVRSNNNFFIPGQPDGDPTVAFTDFLTNQYYGVGFPIARIGSLSGTSSSWQAYCLSMGFGVSPVVAGPVVASSFLSDLVSATNSAACWQNGLLSVVPYGDQAMTQGTIQTSVEDYTVPGGEGTGGLGVITVSFSGQFYRDLGVVYTSGPYGGSSFSQVDFPPTDIGQYARYGGVYYFYDGDLPPYDTGDAGSQIQITYEYATTGSYVPPTQNLYDFTIDDFLPNQGTIGTGLSAHNSPLVVVRIPRDQMLNDIKVEYMDRNNAYNPVDIEFKDSASITAFGRLRPSDVKQFHFFCTAAAATASAAQQLVRAQIARHFQFTVGNHFILILELMAVCTVTLAQMGLDRQPVRIIEIQENQDSTLTITAEEFPGTASAPLYGTQASGGSLLNYNVLVGQLNPPVIFEPTDELGGGLYVWAAVSWASDDTNIGGCQVWASYVADGTYQQIGTITTSARVGNLTTDFPPVTVNPVGQTIDETNTLAVDLIESNGALDPATVADAVALNTACYVGGEVVAYADATLTGSNEYDLTYLVRGAYGTEDEIVDHPAGTTFARLDASIFKFAYDQSRIGSTVYLKFLAFNLWGGGLQTLADVGASAYVITGLALTSPLPNVENLTASYSNGFTQISWDPVTDFRTGIRYKIYQGILNTLEPPELLAVESASGDSMTIDIGAVAAGKMIVVVVSEIAAAEPSSPSSYSVSDGTNIYNLAVSSYSDNDPAVNIPALQLFYYYYQSSSSSVTLTISFPPSSDPSTFSECAIVFSMEDITVSGPPVDKTGANSVFSSTTLPTPTGVLRYSSEIIIGAVNVNVGSQEITESTGFTKIGSIISSKTGQSLDCSYFIAQSPASIDYSPSWSLSGAANTVIASFVVILEAELANLVEVGDVAHPPFSVPASGAYWVSAYCQPVANLYVYSEDPQSITISGTLVENLLASSDQANTGWPGTKTNAVVTGSVLTLSNTEDTATYTIPSPINAGYVAPMTLSIGYQAAATGPDSDVLTITNVLTVPDMLGTNDVQYADVTIQVSTSLDGVHFSAWQNYIPGAYNCQAVNIMVELSTTNTTVTPSLTSFYYIASLSLRVDHYVNLTVPTGGYTIIFQPDNSSIAAPFNGGPPSGTGNQGLPYLQFSWGGSSSYAGLTPVVTALSLSSATFHFVNSSNTTVQVENVNVTAEGY